MKVVFYSSKAKFYLTEEEFENFIKKAQGGEKVWIPRLQVFLSDMFIWAGEEPEDPNRRTLRDGTVAIRKYGTWFCEKSGAQIDMSYYPELAKDEKQIK